MNGMALPSRHRIRNSSPGGLRSSTLPLGHEWASERGGGHFVALKLEGQSGARTRDLRHSKRAALTTVPGPPPFVQYSTYFGVTYMYNPKCWVRCCNHV